MATNADVGINIVTQFTGKGKFKQAEDSLSRLNRQVKGLAKSYIGLYGAQKLYSYGQQSLKAFVADDKAVKQLGTSIANLGLAYEQTNVENFIAGIEKTYHVADDLLRPAFNKLISTTQSYTKSKELLTLALNASAGAGVDLNTTVNDLTQAYVGNTKGLSKYKLGLTKAELAGKSFSEIQQLITERFQGQAAIAADSYAGKMDALTIASGNAKEIIGRGLVDAIAAAFGNNDIDRATTNIEKMASAIADTVAGLGTMTGWFSKLVTQTDKLTLGRVFENILDSKKGKTPFDPMSMKVQDLTPAGIKMIKDRKKADELAAKRQREIAAFAKAAAKAEKERLALKKAGAIFDTAGKLFDMDLIQNTAALMGKISADEALRLKLQQAILLDNEDAAAKLAQQLAASQIAAMKLSQTNPLNGWNQYFSDALAALQQLRDELAKLGAPKVGIPATPLAPTSPNEMAKTPNNPLGLTSFYGTTGFGQPFAPSQYPDYSGISLADQQFTTAKKAFEQAITKIEISIDPLAAAAGVNVASINNNANGNSNNYSTIQSFKGGISF